MSATEKSLILPAITHSLPPSLKAISEGKLQWFPQLGVGFCGVTEAHIYDAAYFHNYVVRDATPTGAALTAGRVNYVRSVLGHVPSNLVDIGIGGGRFVTEGKCLGYDINPDGIAWLKLHDRWFDPYLSPFQDATFWDALEHIPDPGPLLGNIRGTAFVSCPIYKDMAHVLRSKHFKPGEHIHYWTSEGLIDLMDWYGFDCVSVSSFEQHCGREDIGSFAFTRRKCGK